MYQIIVSGNRQVIAFVWKFVHLKTVHLGQDMYRFGCKSLIAWLLVHGVGVEWFYRRSKLWESLLLACKIAFKFASLDLGPEGGMIMVFNYL